MSVMQVNGADVFEIPVLRQMKMPCMFAVISNGEVLVQPYHVGIQGFDVLELLRVLDGTPGCAYVVVPEGGYMEMEKISAENSLMVSLSWLKTINRGSDLERMETQIRSALAGWNNDPDRSQIRRLEGVCGLVGIEGVSNVIRQH